MIRKIEEYTKIQCEAKECFFEAKYEKWIGDNFYYLCDNCILKLKDNKKLK